MSTVSTQRHQVAPSRIRDALAAIWRDCCDTERGDVTRALTHNLVAIADAEHTRAVQDMLADLVARQPCRAFVATLGAGGDDIAAAVHGIARAQRDNRHLLLEQVDLTVPRTMIDRLVGIVRPLLVNDIPTHLFWSHGWTGDERTFDTLAAIADHVIVDSAGADAPGEVHDMIAARRDAGVAVTDLAWLRIRPWRRALAEALERGAYDAGQPTRVTIRHGTGAFAGALLLGRWLEQRLGATVELEPTGKDDEPTPCGVELTNGAATVVARRRDAVRIEVAVTTAQACHLPFAVPESRGREVDLLAAAIALS